MNRESNEFKMISEALNLDKDEFNTDEIKGTIELLKYSDKIWYRIRDIYLKKILSVGNEYELVTCEEKDEDVPHALIHIKKGDEIKAWICVDTNLFIVTRKSGECKNDWKKYKEDYQWQYINRPDNNKHISLKYPTELDNIKIDLVDLLNNAE